MIQEELSPEAEFQRIVKAADEKRRFLLRLGQLRAKNKKSLTIWSGVLALFSAGTVTTVLTASLGNHWMQWMAAATSCSSGLISLFISTSLKDDEIATVINGASQYLALREKAFRQLIQPLPSLEEKMKMIEELHREYIEIDKNYSKYIPVDASVFDYYTHSGYRNKRGYNPNS